jgi:hypothetical protein
MPLSDDELSLDVEAMEKIVSNWVMSGISVHATQRKTTAHVPVVTPGA